MRLIDLLVPIIALVRETTDRPAADSSRPAPRAPAAAAAPQASTTVSNAGGGSPFAPEPIATLDVPVATASARSAPSRTPGAGNEVATERTGAPRRAGDPAASAMSTTSAASPRLASGDNAVAGTLALRFDTLIDEARQAARTQNKFDFDAALFAVLAWADESLISAPWPGASYWQRYLLQRQHFNTTTAGVTFFTRLEDLRDDQQNVREVYALCLSLGFKGRFAYERSTRLLDEKRRLTMQQVLDHAGLPATTGALLFPDAYVIPAPDAPGATPERPAANSRRRVRISRQTALLFGVPLLILVVLYGTYYMIISQMVDAILPLIK